MEIRAQVAYHFKIDPAKLVPGSIRLPEQITRTVAVGDEMTTEKVSLESLPVVDRLSIIAELDKQSAEATRTARPAGSPAPAAAAGPAAGPVGDGAEEEITAF